HERPHRKLTTAPLFGNHSYRCRYTTPIHHPILKSLVLSDFDAAALTIDRWALIPVRLIVGFGFSEHGFAKLAKGPDAFPNILQAMGVAGRHYMEWATILVELLGGLAVILGALVKLASLPMAAVLWVAMFTVHLPYGFSSIKLQAVTAAGAQFRPPGYEI